MLKHFRIADFRLRDYKPEKDQLLVLITGERDYYQILREAFDHYFFSVAFDDQYSGYDWGSYIHEITGEDQIQLQNLLDLLENAVCINDNLDQMFTLDYHKRPEYEGSGRTDIGELAYRAKPYNRPATSKHREAAMSLTTHFEHFFKCHPLYGRSDYLIAAPPANLKKPFDLPSFLVDELCTKLSISNGSSFVRKVRKTQPMKDIMTVQAKTENIRGAFEVATDAPLEDKIVTIIDDIYQSGATMNELASVLQRAGATVLGLAATKTMTDPR